MFHFAQLLKYKNTEAEWLVWLLIQLFGDLLWVMFCQNDMIEPFWDSLYFYSLTMWEQSTIYIFSLYQSTL